MKDAEAVARRARAAVKRHYYNNRPAILEGKKKHYAENAERIKAAAKARRLKAKADKLTISKDSENV